MTDVLNYYEANAQPYFGRTLNLDLQAIRADFAAMLSPGGSVVDIGCGSGRDALAFHQAGFDVTAFDGSMALTALARRHTGLPVQHLRYDQMDWEGLFDGAWACSSLVHLDDEALAQVLARVHRACKPNAAFFTCFKQGEGPYVDADYRSFNLFTLERAGRMLEDNGFSVGKSWLTGHHADPNTLWVNLLARRRG